MIPALTRRWFSTAAPSGASALESIRKTMSGGAPRPTQLTKKERNSLQGNIARFFRKGGKPEFWSTDRNIHRRIFEPMDTFLLTITSSKNNVWITAVNRGRQYRTVFQSHAGNVGLAKAKQRSPDAAYRVAENCARKLKRLGVTCADVRFRKIMRVDQCLSAFQAHGLRLTRLTHEPRLPFGYAHRPRNKRRV